MVVSAPNALSRVCSKVSRGQGIVVQRYGTGSEFTKVSPTEAAHNFSLIPDSSSSSSKTLGSLPSIRLRPLHTPGSEQSGRLVARTDGDLIRVGLRPPYELQVDYDLRPIGDKLHDHPSWTAFLLAFDVEKLRQLGHGKSLDELCASTRRLSWVVRACRCSEFVPLEIKKGCATAQITLMPEAVSQDSLVLVRVLICLKEGSIDSEMESCRDWISWGEPLMVRTLPAAEYTCEEPHLSATEKLIAQLRENLSSREDMQERMEAATAKCNAESELVEEMQAELKSATAAQEHGESADASAQQARANDALKNEFRTAENEHDVLRRGLYAALELAGERGRVEASTKRELEETEEKHCDLQMRLESLQAEHTQLAATASNAQDAQDVEQMKKSLKMAEIQHSAAMQDLRESLEKLGKSNRLEADARFALDASEAKISSMQVELLMARKDGALEAATQADLQKRLQAAEDFGMEMKRQLQIANEEHLAAVQLYKQAWSDQNTPSRPSQCWKENSDCSTSASSPNLKRPESSPCTTLPLGPPDDDVEELRSRWLAASREIEDARAELEQYKLRNAQLERRESDLNEKLVASTADKFVLSIDLHTGGGQTTQSSSTIEERRCELTRRLSMESTAHEEMKNELHRTTQASKEKMDSMEEERSELRSKLAALTKEHERLSLALRTPVKIAMVVEAAIVSFTLKSMDYDAFMANAILVNAFESKVKEIIASEAENGVQPQFVEVEISAGSVKVIAKVETTNAQQVSVQIALSTSPTLMKRLVESVKSIPGMEKLWTSSVAATDFRVEVPWPAEVESKFKEVSAEHRSLQTELNSSVQLCSSLVAKWMLHSAETKLQADARENKLRSLEMDQAGLRGEFKDAALRSIVDSVATKLEMDAALDIGRTETEMQQRLQKNLDSLHKCHEESLNALSIAENKREEVLEESATNKAGIAKAEGAWFAAMRDADEQQKALRMCLELTMDKEEDARSEMDMASAPPRNSKSQVFESENSELRMHLQHALEEHANLQTKMDAEVKGARKASVALRKNLEAEEAERASLKNQLERHLGEQPTVAADHKKIKSELAEERKAKKAEAIEKAKLQEKLENVIGEHSQAEQAHNNTKSELDKAKQAAEKAQFQLQSEFAASAEKLRTEEEQRETREANESRKLLKAQESLEAIQIEKDAALKKSQDAYEALQASLAEKDGSGKDVTHLETSHAEKLDVLRRQLGKSLQAHAAVEARHAEKDAELKQAMHAQTALAEKDAALKKALQAHAALEARHIEKDEELRRLQETQTKSVEKDGEILKTTEKVHEALEEQAHAAKKAQRAHAALQEEQQVHAALQAKHDAQGKTLGQTEQMAQKEKEQRERLKQELEEERKKGKCCSQM